MRYNDYGVPVYAALNNVGQSLRDAVAMRINQKNEEGQLALAMKKMNLENTLAQQQGNLAMAQLESDAAWKTGQAQEQQRQFDARQGMEKDRFGFQKRESEDRMKNAAMQRQSLAMEIEQKKRLQEPISVDKALEEAMLPEEVKTLFRSTMSEAERSAVHKRSDFAEMYNDFRKQYPSIAYDFAAQKAIERMGEWKEAAQKDPDNIEQYYNQTKQLSDTMAIMEDARNAKNDGELTKVAFKGIEKGVWLTMSEAMKELRSIREDNGKATIEDVDKWFKKEIQKRSGGSEGNTADEATMKSRVLNTINQSGININDPRMDPVKELIKNKKYKEAASFIDTLKGADDGRFVRGKIDNVN